MGSGGKCGKGEKRPGSHDVSESSDLLSHPLYSIGLYGLRPIYDSDGNHRSSRPLWEAALPC